MNAAQRSSRTEKHWHAGVQAMNDSRWDGAVLAFQKAVQLSPDAALIWLGLARAQLALGRLDSAAAASRRALQLQPTHAVACQTLAECLTQQHRHDEALAVLESLPAGVPRSQDFLSAHGVALFQLGRAQEAVAVYMQALSLNLHHPLLHYRLGLVFKSLRMEREATVSFRTAMTVDKAGEVRALALPLLVSASRQACDWEHLAADTAALLATLDTAPPEIAGQMSPFPLLAIESTPAQQRRIGQLRLAQQTAAIRPLPPERGRRPGRIRVGYLSADFFHHATSLLIAELLERRDGDRFEVFLYSHSPDDGSAIQQRVRAAADHWLDVNLMSDADVARRMRDDGIDIAIDLKGHTGQTRFELLAHRPAPVQVSYLGYPGSTGADFLDYVIGDPVVTPLAHAPHYSEQIAQMPLCYQPNDSQRPLPPAPSRAELGLPEQAVVLCCFNQSYKISPAMLDLWARILAGAPDTVLWMLSWNEHGQHRLLQELMARGVAPERVYFSPRLGLDEHIARLRCADLFLDTWPYNAHTTASEALWAGVPVLTVPGDTFASRVAASLVSACGLPELACADAQAYVDSAIALAHSPERLNALKQHLDGQRATLPLFDSARHTRDFEALLQRMFDRRQLGLPPAPLAAA